MKIRIGVSLDKTRSFQHYQRCRFLGKCTWGVVGKSTQMHYIVLHLHDTPQLLTQDG